MHSPGRHKGLKKIIAAVALTALIPAAFGQNAYVNFEGKQTSPIRLSPDGTRLFAVNTPDARLSVFDISHPSNPFLIAEIPVGIDPVSVNPRDNNEVWVVNEVSDSVSIVSVSNRVVIDTIYFKDEPSDVVFAAGKAFVSASRNNRIGAFDLTTHTLLTNIAVFGENPRALALSPDGTKVYAAFALSGNRTTLISFSNAPPQITNGTPPMSPTLPPPPQAGLIVDATDPAWTNLIRYTLPDYDVVELDAATMTINRYFSRAGTVNLGLAVHPISGDLYVANTEARNLVHFEPNLRANSVTNRISRIDVVSGAVTAFDLNPGLDYAVLPNLPALSNSLAQPTAVVFDPAGEKLYVAAFGSDRVARMNTNGNVLARIDVGPAIGSASDSRNMRGPRGLALNASAQRLYVLNRIANTISIINTANDTLLKEIPVGSFDPTPPVIRQGRGFLYDAKLSGNGTMSCASCHPDAEMDLLAWDLGDPTGQVMQPLPTILLHPMKGPMMTQTLRGLLGQDPLHWRGDRTNFLHFNVAFPGLLGGALLSNADMAAFRDFINTVVFQPNPNLNLNRTFPANFAGGNPSTGRNFDFQVSFGGGAVVGSCTTCHNRPPDSGSRLLFITGTSFQRPQDFKVPHLRNMYQMMNLNKTPGASSTRGFGMSHDGEFATIPEFLSRPFFNSISTNTTVQNNLAAFLLCFDTGMAPAVGYTRTVTATNVNDANVIADWSILEGVASKATPDINLVVRGTIDGKLRGLLYQPLSSNYRLDLTNLVTLTHAQLVAKIQNGDTLTLMGVPPGSGTRMGIDRNANGIPDASEPLPRLEVERAANKVVIHWPLSAAGFALETSAASAPDSWVPATNAVEIIGGENYVTNTPSGGARLYRLHSPL
jgi:YVTN family beta-propeller protein